MKEMFGGLGRTWLMAVILMVLSTVLLITGDITATMWTTVISTAMMSGGLKSGLGKLGNKEG